MIGAFDFLAMNQLVAWNLKYIVYKAAETIMMLMYN
jgi:hypothetical protein